MTTTTHTHTIDAGTARALISGRRLPSVGAPAAAVALAADATALDLRRTGQGFELHSTAHPDTWADLFGVLPYEPGRVALATSERGAWAAARARVQ